MPKMKSFFCYFILGATLYPLIELLFRGRTHFSMSLLGGICAAFIAWVDYILGKRTYILKALSSAVLITELEFITGMIVNRLLQMNVWDYTALPFQFAGQISLIFSFYWFCLSLGAMVLFRLLGLSPQKRWKAKKV